VRKGEAKVTGVKISIGRHVKLSRRRGHPKKEQVNRKLILLKKKEERERDFHGKGVDLLPQGRETYKGKP